MTRLKAALLAAVLGLVAVLVTPVHVSGQADRVVIGLTAPDGYPRYVPATGSSVAVNITTATTTQLVALAANQRVYVTGVSLAAIGNATPVTAKFVYGTGSTCGTGTTDLTGPFSSGTVAGAVVPFLLPQALSAWFATAAGNALCITSTGTAGLQGVVSYVQY